MSEALVVQSVDVRGSQKWIQLAVAEQWAELQQPLLNRLKQPGASVEWRSPLAIDGHAEYRDAAFLSLVGQGQLAPDLKRFWPRGGPQWDALGVTSTGQVALVEAKAHIREFCSNPSDARPKSRSLIASSLNEVALALDSPHGERWPDQFYQYANRLAHLWFLREHKIDAYLMLVGFLGDDERSGPRTKEAWEAAYTVADYVLGLRQRHALSPYIVHAYPSVAGHV